MMMAELKPYPNYKDSGVPWLGEVPEHWEIRKLRAILTASSERNRPDLPLLSVVREKGVILRDISSKDENHNFIPEDLTNYKVVKSGQFAMNKMKAWQGSYGVSKYHGIVSPAYFVFDVKNVEGNFFNSAIRSKVYIPFFSQASDGVRIGQWDLSQARMREIPLLIPNSDEQSAIVRFLDHADRKIRRYIHAKQRLIKLLEEQKQAIIHQAVTHGLDPNVRLKPSGVEWLGDVPEHWEIIRFGRLIDLITGFPFKSDEFSSNHNDIRLLRGINIAPGKIRWDSVVFWPRSNYELFQKIHLKLGYIVLAMDRPIITSGVRVALISDNDIPSLLLQRVARIRTLEGLKSQFANLLLTGRYFSDYLSPIYTGISVPHISPEQIKSFRFALPSIEEQQQILLHVSNITVKFDKSIHSAKNQISFLKEYRTRLIADVVTGKLDVREAAASLPDVSEEPELTDDTEDLGEVAEVEDEAAEE